jgi:UDP-glucose 4-epimerase
LYEEDNSAGTLKVLLAARDAHVGRVVYSASSSAYGINKIPLRETMTPDPLNPYAKTKFDGEQWMSLFASLYDMETVSLRYFNVYGPGNIYNGPYTTVIALFAHNFKKGVPMVIVGDGKQTRDYTHVFDVVNANILAAENKKVGKGEVINIGFGRRFSVCDVAEYIGGKKITALKKLKSVIFIEDRKGESRDTLADNRRARILLGWKPKVSLLQGIQSLLKK